MRLIENEEKFGDREMYKLVSKNIKFYREHNKNPKYFYKKLTQLLLAEETETSRSLISSIKSEKFYIEFSLAIVNRCAKICNIPLSYYFLKEPPEDFWK